MSGVEIVSALLRENVALLAQVPAAQIKAIALPDDAPLPSLLVRSISEVERIKLRRVGSVRITERIEIIVRAASFRELNAIRILAREACAGRTGDVGGGTAVSITNAGAGPDLIGPGRSYQRGQDLRVSYETPV